jgi:Family of unknown function (DUF6177)
MPSPVEQSPAVDARTDKVVVIMQDRPVVSMSAWLADALGAADAAGLGLQLVTPVTTRLTFAVRSLLFHRVESRWVVTEPDGDGAYDGLSGVRLAWDGQAFAPVVDGEAGQLDLSPVFAAGGSDHPAQLLVTARVRHQPLDTTVVGIAAERVFTDLSGVAPAGWGTGEPVSQPWSPDRLSGFCRRRAPRPTWLAVAGGAGGRTAVGSVEIHVRPAGLEEVVTVVVAMADGLPGSDEIRSVCDRLADSFTLVSFFAQGAHGPADTNAIPHWVGVPAPIAMAIGAGGFTPGGRPASVEEAIDLVSGIADLETLRIGPGSAQGVWYQIGDGRNQLGWNTYSELLRRFADVPEGSDLPVRTAS